MFSTSSNYAVSPLKGFSINWILAASALTVAVWSTAIAPTHGRPSNFEPQPLQQASLAGAGDYDDNEAFQRKPSAIDSYGNPIDTLKPIDTPDGRKVISTQGIQFEIPNYASGLTEFTKPADDLLPPFIDSITSSETESEQSDATKFQHVNPFLPTKFINNGADNVQPKPFSVNGNRATATTTTKIAGTTTTTTTTTATPSYVVKNPFDSATLPTWLSDFDYPDLGPGVPFVYDPTAPFENSGVTAAGAAGTAVSTDPEAFPPFANSATPTKTTFSKSDEGKVITNNVFPTVPAAGQQSPKPFGFGNGFNTQQKDYQATQTNQYFAGTTGFGAAESTNSVQGVSTEQQGATSPFAGTLAPTVAGPGKYTGGFGGAPGVLGTGKVGYAVQPDGSILDPDHTYRPPTSGSSAAATIQVTTRVPTTVYTRPPPSPTASVTNVTKYRGGFGGPPGVLSPYDNVKGQ